jgi:hypothetical protein
MNCIKFWTTGGQAAPLSRAGTASARWPAVAISRRIRASRWLRCCGSTPGPTWCTVSCGARASSNRRSR